MSQPPRTKAFLFVAIVYLLATAAAWGTHQALIPNLSPLWAFAAADAAATLVVFIGSVVVNNSSVYDPYWSVAPMVIAPALAFYPGSEGAPLVRKIVVTTLVLAWGARLTWNWARGWHGFSHEDFRYVDLRKSMGRAYWLVSFLGLHFMPTLSVFLGCLALFPALVSGQRGITALDAVASIITASAITLEARADAELRAFRLTSPPPGSILKTGVWAYCRHPNYLGEIGFWWGIFLFGLSAAPSDWHIVAGPLWITSLFVFVSIPLMDKRSLSRRPAYAEHIARVPALVPRRPRAS